MFLFTHPEKKDTTDFNNFSYPVVTPKQTNVKLFQTTLLPDFLTSIVPLVRDTLYLHLLQYQKKLLKHPYKKQLASAHPVM